MIGFHEQPVTEKGHPNEDPETRDLTKKQLYNMLSPTIALPPLSSKGMTREQLIKSHRREVFTVSNIDLKHFEVELTLGQTKRAGMPNNSLLVQKLDELLESRGELPTGYDKQEPPEEVS